MFQLNRPIRNLISAGILAVLTAIAVGIARFFPDFWFSFYTDFSRKAIGIIGTVTGWIPVCLWQILLILLILAIPVGLVYAIRKKRVLGWLTALLELALLLIFLFVGLWGLNHYAPTIGEQTGLEVRPYSKGELEEAARYYARQASYWSVRVERDENGALVLPDHSELSDTAVAAYDRLAQENDRFSGAAGSVKPLLFSKAFSYMGTTGVYLCLTGEASVNTDTFPGTLPFTMCHELGHSLAVAAEEEANYCGYRACAASEDPLFRYSGYYTAFVYCSNALRRADRAAADKLWELCTEELRQDCARHVAHNKQYEDNAVQKVTEAVNDGYLKAFSQESGVKSYGLVVDYLIADYLASR